MVPIHARPTIYHGIRMRSRTEATHAQWLDSVGIRYLYEPRAYASTEGQYLPDFVLPRVMVNDAPRTVFVEVKGPALTTDEARAQFDRMRPIWASQPDALLLLQDGRTGVGLRCAVRGRDRSTREGLAQWVPRGGTKVGLVLLSGWRSGLGIPRPSKAKEPSGGLV